MNDELKCSVAQKSCGDSNFEDGSIARGFTSCAGLERWGTILIRTDLCLMKVIVLAMKGKPWLLNPRLIKPV